MICLIKIVIMYLVNSTCIGAKISIYMLFISTEFTICHLTLTPLSDHSPRSLLQGSLFTTSVYLSFTMSFHWAMLTSFAGLLSLHVCTFIEWSLPSPLNCKLLENKGIFTILFSGWSSVSGIQYALNRYLLKGWIKEEMFWHAWGLSLNANNGKDPGESIPVRGNSWDPQWKKIQ